MSTATGTLAPLTVRDSGRWLGNDGLRSTCSSLDTTVIVALVDLMGRFQVYAGTTPQCFHVLPSLVGQTLYVPISDDRARLAPVSDCGTSRGVGVEIFSSRPSLGFQKNAFRTCNLLGTYGLGIGSNFGLKGNTLYGYDTADISLQDGNVTSGRQTVSAFATPEQWVGQLGQSPFTITFNETEQPPSLLQRLKDDGHISSLSFGYQQGAAHRVASSPRSPQSPYNPFLSPPVLRLTMQLFRLASPLLPASPLSFFDRTISSTSPTFLQSRTPSPSSTYQQLMFLETATPSMIECGIWNGMSPTFLWSRTPPAIPQNDLTLPECHGEVEADHALERRSSPFTAPCPSPPTNLDQDEAEVADIRRKEMKIEFYHFLAAKRASALNRLSTPPPMKSERTKRARRWGNLLPGRKSSVGGGSSSRSSFKAWSGLGPWS
ncbi:hypothetical protein E8E11_006991 [Didymella keratinophila]|nr:hypothetical protein E8E11_006991 [Didymella keratinophila]